MMAKWEYEQHLGSDIIRCSKCGGDINVGKYGLYYMQHFYFCPYCGKRMSGAITPIYRGKIPPMPPVKPPKKSE